MSNKLCDICKKNQATNRIKVVQGGREKYLDLCNQDYRRLQQQAQKSSPFEMLFKGHDFFSDFFNDFYDFGSDGNSFTSADGRTSDGGRGKRSSREAVDLDKYLSSHAKELIQRAAAIARQQYGRREVDTEHLLQSLCDSDVVLEIFKQFKINAEDIKGFIEYNAPKENHKDASDMDISPRLKKVLELAFQSSKELGHGYVGPEHLLIGLAEEEDGMAGELLRKYGLTPEALRQKVVKVVGKGAEEGKVNTATSTPRLDKYSRDLSALAQAGKLDPVIGRAEEIETTIEILSRRTKNNPVLIGEPGVGKTAIVEGLAQRIVNRDVPETLHNKRVIELNLNSLIAGAKYRGEMEERMKEVLDEISEHRDELIVFIDEIHTILSAGVGGDEGGLSVANIIKPMMARGELHLIGATTLNEYKKYIEKDAALERRFQPVFVPEPTVEQAIEILRGLRDKYEAHHKVKITDESITAAAGLSARYIANRFLPDKAIDLIDQAASRVRIQFLSQSADLQKINDDLMRVTRELEAAGAHKKTSDVADLTAKFKQLSAKRDELNANWKKEKGVSTPEVKIRHIAEVISKITGIPVKELTREEKDKLLRMEEKLHERIISQHEAINAVSNAIRVARAGLNEKNRPQASFMFLGPTGVGKTELVKALAWMVFGDENAIVRLDMSEYMEKHAVARLIGAPPGYVGYEEGGQLTEKVKRRPYSVILLDEIEKAHPDVFNILLQVLDDGRLTDGKGRTIDFTNTIIIATSNLGADLIQQNVITKGKAKKSYPELKNELLNLLRSYYRPEFLNRIDDIIVFQSLNKEDIEQIVRLQLKRLEATARAQEITLEFDPGLIDHIVEEGYSPEFGAREIRRKIKTAVENQLAREIIAGKIKPGDRVTVLYNKDGREVVFK